ncbi:MAG: hypothetical protein FJ222_07595 [Lentisphaerae bacterium]|nr:hypothetical protein [Lentisphaerota bacterium]
MNQTTDQSTKNLDRLLSDFAGKRIAFWTILAIAIHVVVIGMTSLTYIRDTYVDPEGAVERKAAADAEKKRQAQAQAAAAAAAVIGTNAVAGATGTNAAASATGTTNAAPAAAAAATNGASAAATNEARSRYLEGFPESATNSAVAQRMTDVADPEEMPTMGSELSTVLEEPNLGGK